ncbi:hypothetical protein D3C79_975590 [compost metagenome]
MFRDFLERVILQEPMQFIHISEASDFQQMRTVLHRAADDPSLEQADPPGLEECQDGFG